MILRHLLLPVFAVGIHTACAEEALVGTFYGGWARNKGDYIWTRDLGMDAQFHAVGDVNGDGYDDAIVTRKGKWEVALNSTYVDLAGKEVRHFDRRSTWVDDFGMRATHHLVGDLNGDSIDDIGYFDASRGIWEFAISERDCFIPSNITISQFGNKGSQPFFDDVNGDGRPDAVLFYQGRWSVRLNRGKVFDESVVLLKKFGNASSKLFIADVNGDEKADAITLEDGRIQVALSNGRVFESPSVWKSGVAATEVLFDDANGDGMADLILFQMTNDQGRDIGTWEVCPSDGMKSFGNPELWCQEHGSADGHGRISKGLPRTHVFLTGYMNSTQKEGMGSSSIAINTDYGYWQVMPPKSQLGNITNPKWYNSWHTWNRALLSRIGDEYYGFDAIEDTFAIQALIEEMADIGIDYILFDQTNTWGALVESYEVFAWEISKWNKVPSNRKVRYAICGKGWKPGPGKDVEDSARNSMLEFVEHPEYGGDNYQYMDGKPLLVIYGGGERKDLLWADYPGSKDFANRFTIKWMDGHLYPQNMDPDNWGNWYGWALVDGTYENSEQMVVQPGFFNGSSFSTRFYKGIEGDHYRRLNWDKVLLNNPNKVTIITLTADHEQTDVYNMRTGDYPDGMGRTEFWSYPEMYWEMTRDYIRNYRMLRKGEIQHMGEYGWVPVSGNLIHVKFTKSFAVPPVVFASMQSTADSTTATIRVTECGSNSFTMQLEGEYSPTDRINWFAVLPGIWKSPNGLEVVASSKGNHQSVSDYFEGSFAKFDLSNSASGWIAVETGNSEMWSGRFCVAQQLAFSISGNLGFRLPRYFYDKLLTLVDPESGSASVHSTTNLGGRLQYENLPESSNNTLNIISFDGGGGCLYGISKKY